MRVLVVEDDPLVRRAHRRTLGVSHSVVEARDGGEAIAHLAWGEEFDAIVTDLNMPQMGGDELHRWLVVHRPELASRVVVVTAGAQTEAQRQWLASLPASLVLMKPCDPEALRLAVSAALAP